MFSSIATTRQAVGSFVRGAIPYGVVASPVFAPITADLIVVSNPVAGNGRAAAFVQGLSDAIAQRNFQHGPRVLGKKEWITTCADREERILSIEHAIREHQENGVPRVVAVGGDGTFADASEAALRVQRDGMNAVIVPTAAGTACDLRRELGVPRDPARFLEFLATAEQIELSAMGVYFGEQTERRLLMHSLGCGVSGAFFAEVEVHRKRTGTVTISEYLQGLVKGVLKTEPFYASVDGADPVCVGEVLTLSNCTSIGGVTRVPLPKEAGRLHLIPVNPDAAFPGRVAQGVTALSDVFDRGVRYLLGDKRVIDPRESIPALAGPYTLDLRLSSLHVVQFTDREGAPKSIPAILNGDTIGSIDEFVIQDRGDRIMSLAARNADIRIRRQGGVASRPNEA